MSTVVVAAVVFVIVVLVVLGKLRSPARPRRAPSSSKQSASLLSPFQWPSLGQFEFEVVGEAQYQEVIQRLAGDHGTNPADAEYEAELVPEDENRYDPKAVAVRIQGERVAYFSRDDARSFRRRLGQRRLSGQITKCRACLAGGGTRRNGEKLFYGVKLDIKPFE